MVLSAYMEADRCCFVVALKLLVFFFPLCVKAKLSDSSSAAGHYDARCRLIKCLEFMPVSDIQAESETNSVIEFSLSLKTVLPQHLIHI